MMSSRPEPILGDIPITEYNSNITPALSNSSTLRIIQFTRTKQPNRQELRKKTNNKTREQHMSSCNTVHRPMCAGASILGGLGGRTPQILGRGWWGVTGGSLES